MRLVDLDKVKYILEATAKYYEMDNADERTKGIHCGLLHGLDNILDDIKEIEAIPKAEYEARLKADIVAMLTEVKKSIDVLRTRPDVLTDDDKQDLLIECIGYIQQKINALRGNEDGNK